MHRTFDRLIVAAGPAERLAAAFAGAEIVADEARRLVPVLSGNLRDSIIVSARPIGGSAGAATVALGGGITVVFVGPSTSESADGFYGHMIEFGTFKAAAHPFMTPAIENKRGAAQRVMFDRLWRGIVHAARSGR